MTPGTSGPTWPTPFAFFDRESSSWRTSQGSLLPEDSTASSPTWPRSGMTRRGEAFELQTWEPPTDASACSSLPTPTARDHKGHNQRRDSTCLTGALLPTPGANDATGPEPLTQREARGAGGSALRDLPTLLPTPTVNDMGEGKTPEAWDEWTARMRARHGNGNGHGNSLAIEAQRLLPTPTAGDAASTANATASRQPGSQHHAGVTLTDWIRGASTGQRSDDGSPSPDDQLPGQLNLDEPESA